jgi:hypothetical protein
MKIVNKFNIEDRVYLRTDPEQNQGVITSIIIRPSNLLLYEVSIGVETHNHYEFELSTEKNILIGAEKNSEIAD